MASFAKESLSPLLKSANLRRRSLDLCQKIGNHLLSPNASPLFPLSPSKNTNANDNNNSPSLCSSPFKLLSPQSPVFNYSYENETKDGTDAPTTTSASASYHYKRRASDSLWIDTLPVKVELKEVEQLKGRRRSLTPLSIKQSLFDSTSTLLGVPKNKNKENAQDHDDQGSSCHASLEGLQTSGAGIAKSEIMCNIIPPTPLKSVEQRAAMKIPLKLDFRLGEKEHGGVYFSNADKESEEEGQDNSALELEFIRDDNHVGIQQNHVTTPENGNLPKMKERRCSPAAAKYDLDESLMKMLTLNWNLALDPEELLGKGSFGTVVGGIYQGKQVAVKVLKTTNAQRKASVLGEDNALNLPSHNHIARIMDILYVGPDQTLIIMEKMGKGNLLSLLNDPSYEMNSSVAISISKQIALALVFCHRRGILHLDVKPQNILVDLRNCCKLSDFGNSKKVANLDSGQKYSRLEGTVPYTAPELFKGAQPTEKCDVYSFGITMWQILAREAPYGSENEHIVIFRVVSQGLRPDRLNNQTDINSNNILTKETNLSLKYGEIYEGAWSANPNSRPPMTEIHKSLIEIQLLEL